MFDSIPNSRSTQQSSRSARTALRLGATRAGSGAGVASGSHTNLSLCVCVCEGGGWLGAAENKVRFELWKLQQPVHGESAPAAAAVLRSPAAQPSDAALVGWSATHCTPWGCAAAVLWGATMERSMVSPAARGRELPLPTLWPCCVAVGGGGSGVSGGCTRGGASACCCCLCICSAAVQQCRQAGG